MELLPAINFTQAILKYKLIGISPFKLKLKYKLKLHFNWQAKIIELLIIKEQLMCIKV